jgi:hypothetical protein
MRYMMISGIATAAFMSDAHGSRPPAPANGTILRLVATDYALSVTAVPRRDAHASAGQLPADVLGERRGREATHHARNDF